MENFDNRLPKLLYLVSEDWYFCSHRLALASAARESGFDVSVLTRVNRHGDLIRSQGIHLIALDMKRGGLNPLQELKSFFQIWRSYARLRPDIVHHVALKPVLYGGLAAFFRRDIRSIHLIAGLGAIFSSDRARAKLLKKPVEMFLRFLFKSPASRVIVQNLEDLKLLTERMGIPENRVHLIRGSGVDIRKFQATPEPSGTITIALVSRMLWDKGVGEFVEAVRLLKERGLEFQALLVGDPDPENLASVPRGQLERWRQDALVEWLGYREDVAAVWRAAHIAVLPSYREGLPKSLLEAAACGRPIVTTDTSGCKEIVRHGVNGLLVPVRDARALVGALERLIRNPQLRQSMGRAGREMVESDFSDERVIAETLALYRSVLLRGL